MFAMFCVLADVLVGWLAVGSFVWLIRLFFAALATDKVLKSNKLRVRS